jgi:tetratricopeptide (TPR) repeat protein
MSSSDNAFKGIEQYNLQNYESALKHFDLVISENNMHPVGNYYSGLCYLEMEQYNKAIQHFKKVIKENNNLFIEQAEWYMALGYLANKEEKKAYTTLYAIIEKKSYYKKNAEKLLKKLK